MKLLTVVIPTYNEILNIENLIQKLHITLNAIDYEILVVDDNSSDQTWQRLEKLKKVDPFLNSLRRIGRRGLSSAVIEGILIAKSQYVVVLDADFQHDYSIIPEMLTRIQSNLDIIIGSRYCSNKMIKNWTQTRLFISKFATKLSKLYLNYPITDPLSGFFMIRRSIVVDCANKLIGKGYKILLDILSVNHCNYLKIEELYYNFNNRTLGNSKLSSSVIFDFLEFLVERKLSKYISIRFLKFLIVGSIGASLHISIVFILYKQLMFSYTLSFLYAIETATIFNFLMNNKWTFDRYKLKKKFLFLGLVQYNCITLIGGLSNFSISFFLIEKNILWIVALIVGAFFGSIWNYVLNKLLTWKVHYE